MLKTKKTWQFKICANMSVNKKIREDGYEIHCNRF